MVEAMVTKERHALPEVEMVETGVGRGFVGRKEEVKGMECGGERLRTHS